jgi:hypothetical protein
MKHRITEFFKGKVIFLIYLFSYPSFILINNIFRQIYEFIFYGKFDLRLVVRAVWCKSYHFEFQKIIVQFSFFESLKLALIMAFFIVYNQQTNIKIKKIVFEFCVAFLLFDFLYLILSPINYVSSYLNWHYGSQLNQQILSNLDNFPSFIVPLFWVIVLVIFVYFTTKKYNFNYWIYRIIRVLLSFIFYRTMVIFINQLFYLLRH